VTDRLNDKPRFACMANHAAVVVLSGTGTIELVRGAWYVFSTESEMLSHYRGLFGGLKARTLVSNWEVVCCLFLLTLVGTSGCEPPLDVGSWRCAAAPLFIPPDGSLTPRGKDTIISPNWQTGFEDGFCGYSDVYGFCYAASDAKVSVVNSPVRTGRRAAAFSITTDTEKSGEQTRCVREGTLPEEAYYGAWFYLPRGTTDETNWNLIHFQGANEADPLHNLWDVTVLITDGGNLVPWLRGFVEGGPAIPPSTDFELPVDKWFSLHVKLRRSAEPNGEVALYLNGELVVERTDVVTDDTEWGQWYVGNLAGALTPAESTIYVDDVSISKTLPNR
jgi:hypothetical protein